LDLSGTEVSAIPSNTASYPALRTLRLANCKTIQTKLLLEHLKTLPLIELDLSGSTLEDYPEEWPMVATNRIILTDSSLEQAIIEQLEESLLYTTIVSEIRE
jgi:hypothetical protein